LRPAQLKVINSLKNAHNGNVELLSLSLARRLGTAAFLSRRLVGVLLDRRGEVKWVVVGDATRLYLPDIGRTRGAQHRLRGLRLVVARATPLNVAVDGKKGGRTFALSDDFRTDLEKLRLDAVIEFDASRENIDGALVLGYLGKEILESGRSAVSAKEKVFRSVHDLTEPFSSFIDGIIEEVEAEDISETKIKGNFLERAILVGVYGSNKKQGNYSMAELSELARSARVEVVDKVIQWRSRFYPKTLIGPGKLEEICLHALSLGVEMLIFDCDLSPSQLLNITDMTDLKILDRTMLILDIFAQRAVTREGKMQVEMAQLTYSLPRLAQKQSGLSRLTGGIGGRGPGETKLEVNKRRVKDRLARLSEELDRIKLQRGQRRKVRIQHEIPTFAIVGYTNAGKSTLLNTLSGSDIYAKDELFATLDPHSRRLRFPKEQEVLVTDTVGFIHNLPQSLMTAFMATLEELNDADVLLQVVDIADENYEHHLKTVDQILDELSLAHKKRVLVYNKIDLISAALLAERSKKMPGVAISASKNVNLLALIDACVEALEAISGLTKEKAAKISRNEDEEKVFDERG